jgi:hypothetical protein
MVSGKRGAFQWSPGLLLSIRTYFQAPSANGRFNFPASDHSAAIHVFHSSGLVRMTGIALGWIAPTSAWGSQVDALEDHRPLPGDVWNRVPGKLRPEIADLALEEPTLSPRELAAKFTDKKRYFVSESSVCRLLYARCSGCLIQKCRHSELAPDYSSKLSAANYALACFFANAASFARNAGASSTSLFTMPFGLRPCWTSSTTRTSAAPIPAKH